MHHAHFAHLLLASNEGGVAGAGLDANHAAGEHAAQAVGAEAGSEHVLQGEQGPRSATSALRHGLVKTPHDRTEVQHCASRPGHRNAWQTGVSLLVWSSLVSFVLFLSVVHAA